MRKIIENLVSTIIPVYNRPEMLREAVKSVLAQTYRPIEIVISDDGSTDNTPEQINTLKFKHPDQIRSIRNENQGAGPAREAGRLMARGEFIQYLDSDDRLLPRKFEVQVKALRDHPECGSAYGYIRLCPENGPPLKKPFKWSGKTIPTLFPKLLVDRWWNTDCPLWRRTVCDKVGPWSDLRYSQDWEYDSRAGALGVRLTHVKEFVCEQKHHANSRQTGHGKWLEPMDRVCFFSSLYKNAIKAGVTPGCEEMMHFSRWMFFNARQCGALGDSTASEQCCELAIKAAGHTPSDIQIYRRLARIVGWRFIGKISMTAEQYVKRRPSAKTLKQSWMK